jgi:hypothetical protein
MLERLRMQEVSQIIFSLPEGVRPPADGRIYEEGEPIMIIDKPELSQLTFMTRARKVADGKGLVGTGTVNTGIDFLINEGSVLFAVWSYLFGDVKKDETAECKGTEILTATDSEIVLAHVPKEIFIYRETTGNKLLIGDFIIEDKTITITDEVEDGEKFRVVYSYDIEANLVTDVRQIQNNILADVHIYIDALDMETQEKHVVYILIERAQLEMDMVLSVNDSTSASFTPIRVVGMPFGDSLNKHIAKIVVV